MLNEWQIVKPDQMPECCLIWVYTFAQAFLSQYLGLLQPSKMDFNTS